jgi:AraC family transcriptional regulator
VLPRAVSCANETKAGGAQLNSQANDVSTRWAYGSYEDPLRGDSDGRRSLCLRIVEVAPYLDPVELPTFSDPAITLVLNRGFRIDTFSEGRWRGTKYTRGTGKLTPARQGRLIRHHFENQKNLTLLHLILPQNTVDLVAAEVPKAGTTLRSSLSNVSFLDDPLITNLMFSAVAALRCGAPDFYAQASAQWLAAHLLLGPSRGFEWHQSLGQERISDQRLSRVLEYINAHLSDRLDLRVLAKEAGISRFHFAALFSKAVGATPHRHVQHLRMQAARLMLRETDKTMLEIAVTCGFGSASHFASAFRRHFSQSPTEYRSPK